MLGYYHGIQNMAKQLPFPSPLRGGWAGLATFYWIYYDALEVSNEHRGSFYGF